MKKRKIKIIRSNGAKTPIYATSASSGADVYSLESFTLKAGQRIMVHTGIYMELPKDIECQVRPRSGLALKYGITVLNAPGTIDSDYRGECCVILINHGNEDYTFEKEERIAQFVFVENVVQAEFEDIEDFTEYTERGVGGWGHSGKK